MTQSMKEEGSAETPSLVMNLRTPFQKTSESSLPMLLARAHVLGHLFSEKFHQVVAARIFWTSPSLMLAGPGWAWMR